VVRVICDSTGDLTPELIKKYDITIVPLNVHFGQETYRDGIDITADEFYRRLVSGGVHPTTSAPAPGTFLEAYHSLMQVTDEIIVLTISGGISGTFESALQAKNMLENPCNIEVIDTKLTCGGLFLPALRAAQAARQGEKLDGVAAMVRDVLKRTRAYMIFDTLEYLLKGGRIGRARALLGSMLKLNPIITLEDGVIETVAKTRNRTRAKDELFRLVDEAGGVEDLVLETATAYEEMEEMFNRFTTILPPGRIYRSRVSPVIGVHTGPNVLAASFIARK
jgi:DegV family protein with EDD domain